MFAIHIGLLLNVALPAAEVWLPCPAWDALIGWSFDGAQVHCELNQAEQAQDGSKANRFRRMLSSYAKEQLHESQTAAVPDAGLQLLVLAGTRTDIMLLDGAMSSGEATCISVFCRAARRQQANVLLRTHWECSLGQVACTLVSESVSASIQNVNELAFSTACSHWKGSSSSYPFKSPQLQSSAQHC